MNWSDEHYVKLYTRESLTWRSRGWEARTTFLHLLKCVDHSGFIETGRMTPEAALTLQLGLPIAVITPGLAELVSSGTVELVDRAVLIPKFVEAQDARKSDAQKKRDERSRNVAKRRGSMSPAVTDSHPNGPSSPAQPSPAQLEKLAGEKRPPVVRPKRPRKVADPRHAPLVKALCAAVPTYTFDAGKDARQVERLLAKGEPAEVVKRWRRANERSDFPKVRTLAELVDKWPHFATDSPGRFSPDAGLVARHQCDEPTCPECGPVIAAAGGAP